MAPKKPDGGTLTCGTLNVGSGQDVTKILRATASLSFDHSGGTVQITRTITVTGAAIVNIASYFNDKQKLVESYVDGVKVPEGLDVKLLKKIGREIVSA